MKKLRIIISILSLFWMFSMNAQRNNFQEAVEKGKSDLLEILKNQQFNLGVDPEQLREANARSGIPFHLMDFNGLLNYRSGEIESLIGERQKLVVPMVNDQRIVTTISVEEKEQGNFKIAELVLPQYTTEINMLSSEIRNEFTNFLIVEVPNLRATLYLVDERIYTSYDGRELREAQDTESLLKELQAEAREFQREYGDILKRGRLVD